MAITLAFALLFAFLQLFQSSFPDSIVTFYWVASIFVIGIATAQFALWRGQYPRVASIVAGPFVLAVVAFGFSIHESIFLFDVPSIVAILCFSIVGFPAGYLSGLLIAAIFLTADLLRKHLPFGGFPKPGSQTTDMRWDEIE